MVMGKPGIKKANWGRLMHCQGTAKAVHLPEQVPPRWDFRGSPWLRSIVYAPDRFLHETAPFLKRSSLLCVSREVYRRECCIGRYLRGGKCRCM